MKRRFQNFFSARIFNHYFTIMIPFFLIVLLLTTLAINEAERSMDHAIKAQVGTVANDIDAQFLSYYENASLLVGEETLRYENMVTKPEKTIHGLDTLRLARGYSDMLYDIFLYYGEGRLYSAMGVTSTRPYFCSILGMGEESYATVKSVLDSRQRVVMLLDSQKFGDYVLVHCPTLSYGGRTYDVSVGYCVQLETIRKKLDDTFYGHSVKIELTFADGQTVCFATDANGNLQKAGEPFVIDPKAEISINEKWAFAGVSMNVQYDSGEVFSDVQHMQVLCVIAMSIGLLLSMLLSLWMSVRRTRQVRQLEAIVRGGNDIYEGNQRYLNKTDEFSNVRASIERVMQEWDEDRTDSRTYRYTLKERTAEMLFQGMLNHEKETPEQLLQRCGVELTDPFYYIGGVLLDTNEEVFAQIKSVFVGDLYCEYPVGDHRALFYLACLPDPDYTRAQRENNTVHLKSILEQLGGKNVRFYISRVYKELSMMQFAFKETVRLMEQSVQANSNSDWISFRENQTVVSTGVLRPNTTLLEQFREALEQRNKQTALHVLETLEREIELAASSDENRTYLRFCIVQEMMKVELPPEQQAELRDRLLQVPITDPKALHDQIHMLVGRYFCENADVKINFDRVMDYINQHYREYDISLEGIAMHFGVNKSYLSKLFRQRTGMNYIDYLTERRMGEIKRMLTETDEPIAGIFESVGYINKTNYSKKIKAFFGMSASELRRAYRTESTTDTPERENSEE